MADSFFIKRKIEYNIRQRKFDIVVSVEKFFKQAGFSLFLYNYHHGRASLEGVGSQWI